MSKNISAKSQLESIDYYMVGISKLPGYDQIIKLSSNESALGMSPFAIEAAKEAISSGHLYPEVDTDHIALEIASQYPLDSNRIVFGPGSDELLQRIVNTFSGPGQEVIHSENAYMQFPIYAKLAGATPVAAIDNDFHYSVDSILEKVNDNTRIVILANPDNPSGTYLEGTEVRRLYNALPPHVLLIIDAAYEEFAMADDYESGTNLVHESDNVIVTRTFSKVYGMAGLRLGWAYGSRWAIDLLTRIGPSFPINTAAYAAGIAALRDQEHTNKVIAHNSKWVDLISYELSSLGLKVYPSQTNFILVDFPLNIQCSASEANQYLNEHGIIPRQFAVPTFKNKLSPDYA